MTVNSRVQYYVVCDECPDDDPLLISEGQEADGPNFAVKNAIQDGWKSEGHPVAHICPICLRRREEQACVDQDGHRWRTDETGRYTADENGWFLIDDKTAFRRCADCPRKEWWAPGRITGSTFDTRLAGQSEPGEIG